MGDSLCPCITLLQFSRLLLPIIIDILGDFVRIIFSSQSFSCPRLNYERVLSLLSGLPGHKPSECSTFCVDREEEKAAPREYQSPPWIITPAPESPESTKSRLPVWKSHPQSLSLELIFLPLHKPTSPSLKGVSWHGFHLT